MHFVLVLRTFALSLLIASNPAVPSQSAQSTQLTQADAAFQKSAWQAAADQYRAITSADPANGMAWFRLAASLEQLQRGDDALAAYGRAIELSFQPGRAEVASARILARKGGAGTADALDHLRKAIALGVPPAMIEAEPALAPIRALPEFAALKAKADEARYPCRAVHTFDFWVGDFDTMPWNQPGGPAAGSLHNTREYEGCVIIERWTGAGNAGGGMSMAFYDVNRKAWRMIWNSDGNSSNDFEGTYRDGAMRFEGWMLDPSGQKVLTSNVLQDVSPDLIRHIFSTSADNGKTWVVRSDGRFVRKTR